MSSQYIFLIFLMEKQDIEDWYHLQCPVRLRLGGLVESQPPEGVRGSSGPRCRIPGPGTGPWPPYGPGRTLPTCLAPPRIRLHTQYKIIGVEEHDPSV